MWTNRLLVLLIVLVGSNTAFQITSLRHQSLLPRMPLTRENASPPRSGVQDVTTGTLVDTSSLPSVGNSTARVAVVEFADYECPFCSRHASEVLQPLQDEFVRNGKIRYAFANFPLPNHTNARFLASAAICAGDQGQYWRMHDELFKASPKTREAVVATASRLHLNTDTFQTCLNSPEVVQRLDRDLKQAEIVGVRGTPTFAIGLIDANGRVRVQKLIVGAEPLETFSAAVNDVLAKIKS